VPEGAKFGVPTAVIRETRVAGADMNQGFLRMRAAPCVVACQLQMEGEERHSSAVSGSVGGSVRALSRTRTAPRPSRHSTRESPDCRSPDLARVAREGAEKVPGIRGKPSVLPAYVGVGRSPKRPTPHAVAGPNRPHPETRTFGGFAHLHRVRTIPHSHSAPALDGRQGQKPDGVLTHGPLEESGAERHAGRFGARRT